MFELIDMLIVRPIANILFIIYGFVGDFGFAIILFTVLVKICLWPLVKRQLHQTRLMRKIQPELAEIKKNCNGNRQLESLQMMDLYKRNNIKPFRSMITLLIQLPIFIALYTAVRVMVLPTATDNLELRAYAPVRQIERIEEVTEYQKTYLEQVAEYQAGELSEQPHFNFEPKLFGLVSLSSKPGFTSVSAFVMLLFALASALTQYWVSRQQLPSKKSGKSKAFRQIMKEAANGIEPDQAELNQVMTNQMSFMLPAMMFLIMINLPGALVFYYCISNLMTVVQQRLVLNRDSDEMEIAADKRIIRELKDIKEGQIVEEENPTHHEKNKNIKITRISAGRGHKKRR